jgi:hypothetical protein
MTGLGMFGMGIRKGRAAVWLAIIASISAVIIAVFVNHHTPTDNGSDYEQGYPCKSIRSALFKSAEDAENAVPDAKTILRVTIAQVWGQSPTRPLSEENPGLSGLVSVDDVIKGTVPTNKLFIGVANKCMKPLTLGETGFLAGEILSFNNSPIDKDHSPVFRIR